MSHTEDADHEVSRLLQRAAAGEPGTQARLLELVYGRLHAIAERLFIGQPEGVTLQPTALVHEAWLKIAGKVDANGRRHFFLVAAQAMRQVLTDAARRRQSLRYGDGSRGVSLDIAVDSPSGAHGVDLLVLHDSLEELARLQPVHAQLVELRVLGGCTMAEAAEALGLSPKRAESAWAMARAWLRRRWAAP